MTKQNRLALIKALYTSRNPTTVVEATEFDTEEEVTLVTAGQDLGNLPIDDDLPELSSHLPFERVKEREEDDGVLSPYEREQVRRDLLAYRAKHGQLAYA
jgi:hypothetical protein